MEELLKVEHLVKTFGKNEVLKDIDFSVQRGDVISIIGASGSGKSTLLRCINMLEDATSGNIIFGGKDVLKGEINEDKYRTQVGMVFQSFNLFANLNVLDNCMVGQTAVSKRKKEEAEKIDYGIEVGNMLYHRTYGEGSVIEIDKDKITIKFKDICRSFSLKVLMENNLVILIN